MLFLAQADRPDLVSVVTLRMYGRVEGSDRVHIPLHIPRGRDGRPEAPALLTVVEICRNDGHARIASDVIKARLPVVAAAAGSFRWDHQREVVAVLELMDHVTNHIRVLAAIDEHPADPPDDVAKHRLVHGILGHP